MRRRTSSLAALSFSPRLTHGCLAVLLAFGFAPAQAQTINFATYPLFLTGNVKPNLLVVYDNSQSMDGTMGGKLIAGSDPTTRGNIARSVLRDTITTYRNNFNWGLGSFELIDIPALNYTYPYYFGSDTQVVYTNTCWSGWAPVNGQRCIANPEPANGFNFITYARTGDDADVNDVLYVPADMGPQMYGLTAVGSFAGAAPTDYWTFLNHNSWAGAGWSLGSFSNGWSAPWSFTPTDAGFTPSNPPYTRQFYLRRAWGYSNLITGKGVINQPVAADSTAQYSALMSLLATETNVATSAELKNAAVFTPLAGTMGTAAQYFNNTLTGKPSPVGYTCQRNFVVLATDGNPTGKTDGTMYSLAEQANVYNASTNTWAFSTAANDVFSRITALRGTTITNNAAINGNYDIQTYVIGLGETLTNASSVATLNEMAKRGGTAQAYLATDTAALRDAFAKIAADISRQTAAAASVSLNAGSWSVDADVFQARFSAQDWSGQLLDFRMDASGMPLATPRWDAAQRLNAQNWNTGRQIFTYRASGALGSRGVPFRWPANAAAPTAAEIDSAMVAALNTSRSGTTDTYGSQRLSYLRGDTSRELRNCASCSAPTFRDRATSVLGDIINSSPVYVGSGGRYYRDTIEAQSYSAYRATRSAMTPMIYVGANDGMLHGFNATNGNEVFAYVPSLVASRLSALTDKSYTHQYTVDGSPASGDVYYGSAWHTVLVGGLAAGGKGLYGLDISDPTKFTEATASSVVRWEIGGSDNDVGYIFHQPVLAKMKNGRWMAIAGNGYNSTNGMAVLLLIDIETGAVTKISTLTGGTGTASNGLSGVVAVSSANNGIADIVYAGDLAGNMWKFDLSSTSTTAWSVAYGSASSPQSLYKSATSQPITSRPDVTPHPQGGYMVTFGTGRYIDTTDNSPGSTQSMYGIWDSGTRVESAGQLVAQTVLATPAGTSGKTFRLTTFAVDKPATTQYTGDNTMTTASYFANKRGWYLDLPVSGERIVSQAAMRYGKVVVSTLIPNTQPCKYGGTGWVMEVDAITGNRPDTPSLDTNGDNLVTSGDLLSYSGGTGYASGQQVDAIPVAPGFIRAKDRSLDDKLVNTSSGTLVKIREAGNGKKSGRAGWEQIQ